MYPVWMKYPIGCFAYLLGVEFNKKTSSIILYIGKTLYFTAFFAVTHCVSVNCLTWSFKV